MARRLPIPTCKRATAFRRRWNWRGGTYPISEYLAAQNVDARINFGASSRQRSVRILMATGATVPSSDVISAPIMHREQERAYTAFDALAIDWMGAIMTGEIADDALRPGMINEFLQAATRADSIALFSVAAATKCSIFPHVRRSAPAQGCGPLTPMEEVIAMAAATGGPLNICHVGSEAVGAIDRVLALIRGARTQGLNVTTEAYPCTAGGTLLGSVLFDKGWQEWIGGDYGDIEWPTTGERLTAESFER